MNIQELKEWTESCIGDLERKIDPHEKACLCCDFLHSLQRKKQRNPHPEEGYENQHNQSQQVFCKILKHTLPLIHQSYVFAEVSYAATDITPVTYNLSLNQLSTEQNEHAVLLAKKQIRAIEAHVRAIKKLKSKIEGLSSVIAKDDFTDIESPLKDIFDHFEDTFSLLKINLSFFSIQKKCYLIDQAFKQSDKDDHSHILENIESILPEIREVHKHANHPVIRKKSKELLTHMEGLKDQCPPTVPPHHTLVTFNSLNNTTAFIQRAFSMPATNSTVSTQCDEDMIDCHIDTDEEETREEETQNEDDYLTSEANALIQITFGNNANFFPSPDTDSDQEDGDNRKRKLSVAVPESNSSTPCNPLKKR